MGAHHATSRLLVPGASESCYQERDKDMSPPEEDELGVYSTRLAA